MRKYKQVKRKEIVFELINRMNIHSIGELEAKSEETDEKIRKLTEEFNALNAQHSELEKLLQQIEVYYDLSSRDKLSLSEKMRLQIIKQTLSRHGAMDASSIDRIKSEHRDLDKKISALKTELEGCQNLKKAYQEIRDTYNDISKGDYISKLIEKRQNENADITNNNSKESINRSKPRKL